MNLTYKVHEIRLSKSFIWAGLANTTGHFDGPVAEAIFRSLKGVALSRPDLFADFQCERAVYHDDMADYSSNEPTMDGTASAILLLALASVRH